MLCFLFRAVFVVVTLAFAVGALMVLVEPNWRADTRTLELRLRDTAELRAEWLQEEPPGAGESTGETRPHLGLTEEDRARLTRLLEEKLKD